jgi:hypothetical protein
MKIIFKFLIIFIIIIISFVSYFSLVGIETKKFNNQITTKIKKINNSFEVELKEIKIILDIFKLKLQVKTIGTKLKNKDKVIEFESIKTQIPLESFFNEKFILESLDISTKTLELKDLISFIRVLNKKPEFYILEKVVKKGFLVADIKLNFDAKGNLKNNYNINGFIKDSKINIFEQYKLDKLNFTFSYKENNLNIKNADLLYDNLNFFLKDLVFKKENNKTLIKGEIENKNIELNDKNIQLFIRSYFPKLDIKNLKFSSKNIFSFNLNKKFQLNDVNFISDIQINELSLSNSLELKNFFPKAKKDIKFSNFKIKLDYKKKDFIIDGTGNVKFQDYKDELKFTINKKDKILDFKTSLKIEENQFIINFLNYEKNLNNKALININGKKMLNEKIKFHLIHYKEKNNIFKVEDLVLNKNFKFIDFKKFETNYTDKENKKNNLKVILKDKTYRLLGSDFNANKLIDSLIVDNDNQHIINKDFKLNIKIDNLFLDKVNSVSNFQGNLVFKKGKVINGNLIGFFSNNKKLNFTVKSVDNEKITTLFLDKAEPIVNRYKFIKGFNEGTLDFYSAKKGKESISTLKIYDFKLKELPALTKLLTLASLQGIADLLSGEGIRFSEFEMNFRNEESLMTIDEIYAIGPAISILMDGYVEKDKLISLRGTLVPATTLNKAIGSIPLIGDILVGKKVGEGVFGVSFKIKGPPKKLETTVNPIKTLTPRFITRTIEKIKKN